MDIILQANIINGIGVFFLIFAHAVLSFSNNKYNFLISALGCVFLIIGSLILKSYPVVFLNSIWLILSLSAYFEKKILPEKINNNFLYALHFSFLIGILSVCLYLFEIKSVFINFENLAAFQTTFIYLFAYVLFIEKIITKKEYLIWTTLGFFILLPHLIFYFQYSVLFNEVFGAILGILGIIKIIKKENVI